MDTRHSAARSAPQVDGAIGPRHLVVLLSAGALALLTLFFILAALDQHRYGSPSRLFGLAAIVSACTVIGDLLALARSRRKHQIPLWLAVVSAVLAGLGGIYALLILILIAIV